MILNKSYVIILNGLDKGFRTLEYLVISFTHKNTDIATREKIAFNNDLEKDAFLKKILSSDIINEAILLSTCNRIELLISTPNSKEAGKIAISHFANHSSLDSLNYSIEQIYMIMKVQYIISLQLHLL